jgi:uncharacterized membrane protein
LLVPAVQFFQVVLAIHVMAVVVAFGITFAYPVFLTVGRRRDPRVMPWFHRMQRALGRRITNPGLTVVVIAGIYLATCLHLWSHFFVQWGVGAALVLGALEGSFMIRYEGKLAELAERDIAGAGEGPVTFSPEYEALFRRVGLIGGSMSLLVLATIYVMVVNS